jgi:hypothetical protein
VSEAHPPEYGRVQPGQPEVAPELTVLISTILFGRRSAENPNNLDIYGKLDTKTSNGYLKSRKPRLLFEYRLIPP